MAYGKFNGSIGITEHDSVSSHAPVKNAPNTPNIMYIVLDDVGFAQLGAYGSTIATPNIDKLAQRGLTYNNFHTTAICSATRASLLTGANHHSVGVRTVVDTLDGSYPNQTGYLDPAYATTAEVLKEYGYTNFCVGKWHLTPFQEATDAGPFENWPLGKGFDRFYGFMEGYTDQYLPDLVKDNEHIRAPKTPEEGYHLSEDLADQAIKLVNRQHMIYPDKPFFLYFALGTAHAPHQAPKEYIDKYKGKFDAGWDKIREQWLENQKRLGIAPENTILNERNQYVRPWDELSEDEKKVYARHMEVFAGFLEHADAQIGRVLDYLEEIGILDDTVIVLLSDNGASAEGGKNGRVNQEKSLLIEEENNNVELALPHLEEMGSSKYSNPHYPIGWANAGNTPFQWYKSWVHSGGVKDPLIVSYPKGIKKQGEVRSQYLHVIDIAPTILDILGVEKPSHIKGVPQKDYHGISFAYTFDDAEAPNRKHTQYYEQTGNRAIWHDGWKAITNHIHTTDYIQETWELYHTDEDFSEAENVADKYPEKLQELIFLWYAEAGKYGVLPLGSGPYLTMTREEMAKGESYSRDLMELMLKDVKYEYEGILHPIDVTTQTIFKDRNFKITVHLNHSKGQDGILYSAGNHFGGYTLYIKDNHLKFAYNYHREAEYIATSAEELPEGKCKLQIRFQITGEQTAKASLYVNDREVGSTEVKGFIFMMETHAFLKDGGSSAVSSDFTVPFEYPEKIDKVIIEAASYVINKEEVLQEFFDAD